MQVSQILSEEIKQAAEPILGLRVMSIYIQNRDRYRERRSYYHSKPRLYINPKGESVLCNLFYGRHNRPVKLYREIVIPEIIQALAQKYLLDSTNIKFRWSQYAGCSCPCSPGFIVSGCDRPIDIWVEVEVIQK